MARKNTPDARNRILQAAIKIFAEKSFEGSRIDEIANEAKVPKSLIYYHFKNKDEIFEVLVQDFLNGYTAIVNTSAAHTHKEKAEEIPSRMNSYSEFAIKNADIIRIILLDSFKKSTEKPIIYEILEATVATEEKSLKHSAEEKYDRKERLIAEFFTSILPNCAYLCFAESFVNYFDMDRPTFDKLFLNIITETHGAYHKNHK